MQNPHMRIFVLFCFLVAGVSAQQQQPQPTLAPSPRSANVGPEANRNENKAKKLLDQMIEALGGQAYMTLQDSYTEGRYGRFHNETMVGGAVFYRYWEWPDKERFEVTKERDIATLVLGDRVYEITYRGGKELDPQKDDSVRMGIIRRHYALDLVLRQWLNEPGTLLLDEGPTLADNKMTERVTVINSKNEAVSILISPDTHLPVSKRFSIRDPNTADKDEEEEIYDNWRMVQGINTPYSVVVLHNGQIVRQQYFSVVSYNTHPPAEVFTPKLIAHNKK
jgi:hypothetical protein